MIEKGCNKPEFITGFIDIYRSHPCLWKIKSKFYSNRQLRDKAYASLLQYYKSVDKNATIDTVKNKINNLRSSFRKELKKVNKSKKFGSGTDEIYVPTLWYYKLLLFTSDQEEPIQPISNDEDAETENSENGDKPDEFDTIGENVAHKFRRLNEEQRLYAEHLINKTLFYAIQNRLTSESDIVLSQSVNETVYNVSYSSYLNNHQIPVPNQPCVFERQYQPPVQDVPSELTKLISFKK
ncbi:uncharacterized protein [Leptinotarsa decemlineata]|uniref:uncharacterized protein n=1 Tax=Leptinotarsa decemlineata TaxID=7539 RepID=UPI003D306415